MFRIRSAVATFFAIVLTLASLTTGVLALGQQAASATPSCSPGVGENLQAVFDSSPGTTATTVLPGDVLEYIVTVYVAAAPLGCAFSGGTVVLTTPAGGTPITLATGLSLSPGSSVTYATDNNVVGDTSVISPFTYTVNAADIGKTNLDPEGSFLPPGNIDVWSHVSGTSGTATGSASPDFYSTVVFQPTLTTSLVSVLPGTAPASITDSSTLSGLNDAASAAGTVTYNLYSGNSGSVCTGTPAQSTSAESVIAGVPNNGLFTSVAGGNYEIQAVYSGDPATFNLGATSACGSEPFTVNGQPTLTTSLVSVSPGTAPASITDSSTLSGLNDAASAAGTVTYNLYSGNSGSVCTGTPAQSTSAESVIAGVPNNGLFTSVAGGNYEIQAVYSGDPATFNLGATSACGSEPFTVNGQPTLTTSLVSVSPGTAPASITDSSTLSGLNDAASAAGTVTYNLYSGNSGSVCTGTPAQSTSAESVIAGVPNNGLFTSVAGGNYEIQAVYSGDPATFNLGATSACGSEPFTVNGQPTLTTSLVSVSPGTAPASITDSSTLSGLNDAASAAGTVTYNLYSGNSGSVCTGTPAQSTSAESVIAGVPNNGLFTSVAGGNYEIQAVYSGDPATFNLGATSACGSEPFTVNGQPTLTTSLVSVSPGTAPASITDSSTLSGLNDAASAAGTVTYNLYSGNSGSVCTGTPAQSTSAESVIAGVPNNGLFTSVAGGNYEIQAVYSGDPATFNLGATSACGSEPFTVNGQPTLTTSLVSVSPGTAPASITDSSTLSGLNDAASAAGTVTYNLYSGNSGSVCTGTPAQSTSAESVIAGVPNNGLFTSVAGGNYEIQAVYSGDPATFNLGATSACGSEPFTVIEPLVQVTKTADPVGPVTAGSSIGFDITVANVGTVTASGVNLNDPLPTTPAGVGTWSITSGPTVTGTVTSAPSCSISASTLTCTPVDIAADEYYTLTVTASTATSTSGTATNTATITSTNGNCTTGTTDTRCSSTAKVTITPPVVTGEILPTNTECSDFVNQTTPALPGIFYRVSGGKIGQSINPGVFFYYTYVTTTTPNQVVTTSQSATNLAALFTLNQGHAWLYTAACGLVSHSPTLAGAPTGSAASFTIATPGTYVLRLQYSTKSIAGTKAPSPAGSVYSFDINGTVNASVPLIKQ